MSDKPFDQFFSEMFGNIPKSEEKEIEMKRPYVASDFTPYILRIKHLERQTILLANNCAVLASKVHEQNSDHWLALTDAQAKRS